MKINIILFLTFLIFIIFFISCDDTTTGIDNKTIPSSNVSFNEYILPVFLSKCANSGCHNDAAKAGGIILNSYVGATDPSIVIKGDPDNSLLVWTIEGSSTAQAMPPLGYSPLTTNQIDGIKTWIKEGAKNN